ncbi:MAG: hypothetical protein ACLQDL_04975 [Spirochaetia bacterium]
MQLALGDLAPRDVQDIHQHVRIGVVRTRDGKAEEDVELLARRSGRTGFPLQPRPAGRDEKDVVPERVPRQRVVQVERSVEGTQQLAAVGRFVQREGRRIDVDDGDQPRGLPQELRVLLEVARQVVNAASAKRLDRGAQRGDVFFPERETAER